MNDDPRKAIRDSAHRLRSRLTFIMLCSHMLKLDLRDVLSLKHEAEFHKMDLVLEETKAVLNTLLRQCEQLPTKIAIRNGDETRIIGARTESEVATF